MQEGIIVKLDFLCTHRAKAPTFMEDEIDADFKKRTASQHSYHENRLLLITHGKAESYALELDPSGLGTTSLLRIYHTENWTIESTCIVNTRARGPNFDSVAAHLGIANFALLF